MNPTRASIHILKEYLQRDQHKFIVYGCKGCGKSSIPRQAVKLLISASVNVAIRVVCGYIITPPILRQYPNLVLFSLVNQPMSWSILSRYAKPSLSAVVMVYEASKKICRLPPNEAEELAREVLRKLLGPLYEPTVNRLVELAQYLDADVPEELEEIVESNRSLASSVVLNLVLGGELRIIRYSEDELSEVERNMTYSLVPVIHVVEVYSADKLGSFLNLSPAMNNILVLIYNDSKLPIQPPPDWEVIEIEVPTVAEWSRYMVSNHGLNWLYAVVLPLDATSQRGSGYLLSEVGELYLKCTPKQWTEFALTTTPRCSASKTMRDVLMLANNVLFELTSLDQIEDRKLRKLVLLALVNYEAVKGGANIERYLLELTKEVGPSISVIPDVLLSAGLIGEEDKRYLEDVISDVLAELVPEEEEEEKPETVEEEQRAEEKEETAGEVKEEEISEEASEEAVAEALKALGSKVLGLPLIDLTTAELKFSEPEGFAQRYGKAIERVKAQYMSSRKRKSAK